MPQSFALQGVIEDPLLSRFELGLRGLFYPLGFPLEVQTNSPDVIQATAEGWGSFSKHFDLPSLRIAIGVRERALAPLPDAASSFLAREHLLSIILDAGNFLVCDLKLAFSFGWITPELAGDHARLRYQLLTPSVAMMAESLALAPLHGALVARNGCGVALCGDSCAGKSTLAYACARAGWVYISDDATFLVRDRDDRYAVGNPYFFRFREDARKLFPELAGQLVTTRPNGKIGVELSTRDLPIAIAEGAGIAHLVFLDRNHSGPVRLRAYPKDRLEAWCERYVNFGPDYLRAEMTRCHRRLLDAGIWEMSYEHLEDAVRRLERLVDSGG